MERRYTVSIDRIAIALLLAVFALSVYRAATQSITVSEATTFDRWIRPPIRDILPQPYDPNNHVLNTLLVKRSVGLLRLSEFSMRVPALLGGALYLWAVYRLSRRLAGAGPLLLAAVALMILHPRILDSLCVARGYSLALALFLSAIEAMLAGRTGLAAFCLGLAPAADLAFLWPAAALGLVYIGVEIARGRAEWIAVIERFAIPSIATGFILLAIPLSHAQPGNLVEPAERQPIWLVPLVSVALVAAVRRADSKPLSVAALSVAALLPAWYISQIRVQPRNAGARKMVEVLQRDAAGRHVEIYSTRELAPVLSFYRARYRLSNWEPVGHQPANGNYDYYVLDPQDTETVAQRHLQVLYRDAGLLLAR